MKHEHIKNGNTRAPDRKGAHLRIVNPHTWPWLEQRAQCSKNLAKQHTEEEGKKGQARASKRRACSKLSCAQASPGAQRQKEAVQRITLSLTSSGVAMARQVRRASQAWPSSIAHKTRGERAMHHQVCTICYAISAGTAMIPTDSEDGSQALKHFYKCVGTPWQNAQAGSRSPRRSGSAKYTRGFLSHCVGVTFAPLTGESLPQCT